MQIAQIVVKTRTTKEDIFDYEIPPEILPGLKIGSLVEVPFGNRTLLGVVVGLKRRSDVELKKIITLIDPKPAIDLRHIKLAKWMSDYYLSSFGQTIFENIVPPAIRSIKKSANDFEKLISIKSENQTKLDNLLIIADFQTRIRLYFEKIRESIKRKRSVIILVPDLSMIEYFQNNLAFNTIVLHAGLTRTQRWLAWNKIRLSNYSVVIGSQSALFSPVNNLGLIIIDQEENETYKSDRTPRFHALDVAMNLSKLAGSQLVVGSLVPRAETYWLLKGAKFKIMRKALPREKCTVVDMNSSKSIISATLEQKIIENLSQNRKILLVLNRKGEGSKYSCADCGWTQACQKCGVPLIPREKDNYCFRCESAFPKTVACPKCQGINFKPLGLGTLKLQRILEKIFPKNKIITIQKGAHLDNGGADWNIAVATSYALKKQLPTLGLVAIIDADQNLNLPDFGSVGQSFEVFYKFLRLAPDKIIQTHHPDHYMIKKLASLDSKGFLQSELKTRQNEHFPPFYRLVRLEYLNPDLKLAEKGATSVYHSLLKLKDAQTDISSPYQPFIQKKRDKFRYQIIIKEKRLGPSDLNEETKSLIKNLPKGWIVDVDPFSLM